MEKATVHIALFAALIAALGLIPKLMLTSGVPITAQSMGIMMAGTILGAKRGAAAVALFVALTLAGLPLLSGGRGGLGVLAGPSVGFVVGFPIAAWATGWIMERLHALPVSIAAGVAAMIGGIVILYIPGVAGMALMLDKSWLQAAMLISPFLPGDLIKAVITAILTQAIFAARPASVFSRSGSSL